jgi:hypothetical protein
MFNEFESLQYNNKEIKFYTPTKKTAGRVNKIFRKERNLYKKIFLYINF